MKTSVRALVIVATALVVLLGPLVTATVASTPPILTWTKAHPTKSPPGRDSAAIATDGDTIVMFGGETATSGKILGDTWTWTKGAWTHDTSAVHPPPLAAAAMAYDPVVNEMVLFGGEAKGGATSDETWLWSGGKWSQDKLATAPSSRAEALMAYSPANKGLLLFGGAAHTTNPTSLTDTWLWTRSGWRKLSPKPSPPGSLFGSMVTDTSASQVVLYSGLVSFSSETEPGETWIWNGSKWSERKPTRKPPVRVAPSTAFDPGRGGDVLFGGFSATSGKVLSDAWAWNGSSWTELTEKSPPPARGEAAMAYDATAKKLLVFSGSTQLIGIGGGKDLVDTWLGGP